MEAVLERSTAATLLALLGGLLGIILGEGSRRRLATLISAAAGALLAVTVCDVLPDAKQVLGWPAFLLALTSGYIVFWLCGKYAAPLCPACALSTLEQQTFQRLRAAAPLLLIALGLHSLMDGIAFAVAQRLSGRADFGVLLAISLHKLPEGMALALLLIGAGYKAGAAMARTVLVEIATEIGGLLGVLALHNASPLLLGLLFAHVGGGFLYLVGVAFRPLDSVPASKSPTRAATQPFAIGGGAFVATVAVLWVAARFTVP